MPCAGRPLLAWCVEAFARSGAVGGLVVAAPGDHLVEVEEVAREAAGELAVRVVQGGAERSQSVGLGLESVETELVAVHDAARPLVDPGLIAALIDRLGDRGIDGAIAAAPVPDTVKRVAAGQRVISGTEDRASLWAAQTPQAFATEVLRRAHAGEAEALAAATDDAMLVERAGGTVVVEPATGPNFKVTTPADLHLAGLLLRERDVTGPPTGH